jgi:hypothetical protein
MRKLKGNFYRDPSTYARDDDLIGPRRMIMYDAPAIRRPAED